MEQCLNMYDLITFFLQVAEWFAFDLRTGEARFSTGQAVFSWMHVGDGAFCFAGEAT